MKKLLLASLLLFSCTSKQSLDLENSGTSSIQSNNSKLEIIKKSLDNKNKTGLGSVKFVYNKNKIYSDTEDPGDPIFSLDYDGNSLFNEKVVAHGSNLIVLKDDSLILNYVNSNKKLALGILNTNSLKIEQLYESPAFIVNSALSHDKKTIAFIEPVNSNLVYIKIFNLETKRVTSYFQINYSDSDLIFSGDNKNIFVAQKGGIISLDINSKNKSYLIKDENYNFSDLALSPDKTSLAFSKDYKPCSNKEIERRLKKVEVLSLKNTTSLPLDVNYNGNLLYNPCKPDNVKKLVNESYPLFFSNEELVFHSEVSVKRDGFDSEPDTPILDSGTNIIASKYKTKQGKFITLINEVGDDGYIDVRGKKSGGNLWFIDQDRKKIVFVRKTEVYSINFDGSDEKLIVEN
ncbi:MAG: hypothetical protein U0457_20045 [Candidatus Sericytochromatia bacterium]